MAIAAQCDCNDAGTLTLLSAHTACSSGVHTAGLTWSKVSGLGDVRITAAGRLQPSSSSGAVYAMSIAPADADYTVLANLWVGSDSGQADLIGRQTGASTYYRAGFDKALGRWAIYKVVNGTTTQIGTTTALAGLTAGRVYAVQFDLQGSSLTLRIDGATVAQATDSAITATGKAGLVMKASGAPGNELVAYQLDSVRFDDVVVGSAAGGGGGGGGGTSGSGGRLVATHRARATAHARRGSGGVITPPIDITPPVILPGTIVVTPGTTTANVAWSTNESATSVVDYGTSSAYGTQATGSIGTTHSVALSSLTAATTYHYRITTVDAAGNSTQTDDLTFTTNAVADTTPPVVSSVSSGTPGQASATITWTTNENADSQVEYGTTTAYGSATTIDATLVTSHSVPVLGLAPGTLYHYRVRSRDASGNLTIDSDRTLTTATPIPAPTPSNVAASAVTSKAATISGSVDQAASSIVVRYGLSAGSLTSTSSASSAAAGGTFSISLANLTPSTTYFYRVDATGAGGTGSSSVLSFTTRAPAVQLSQTTLLGVDTDTGVLAPYVDTNNGLTEPVKVTYTSIGVDLRFSRAAASDNVTGNPTACLRFRKAGEPDQDWQAGSGGWRYHISDADAPVGIKGRMVRMEESSEKSFLASLLLLEPATTYDCEITVRDGAETAVIPFSATTWVDAIPAPASLAATHYVNYSTGDDSRTAAVAQNPATPWKTLGGTNGTNGAISKAPSGAVLEVAPGFYPILNTGAGSAARTTPLTIKGASPCVSARNSTTRAITPLTTPHAVVCGSLVGAPAGSPTSDPYGVYSAVNIAPWVPIQVVGPGNGQTYTIYRWSATGLVNISQIGYGADRFGRFTRAQYMDNPGAFTAPPYSEPLPNTPGGFAELIATSPTVFQGAVMLNGSLYMVWVRSEDPNSFWWEATSSSKEGPLLRGPNIRVTQMHVRTALVGVDVGISGDASNVTDVVVDHNFIDLCQVGVRVLGGGTSTCNFRNGNLPRRVTIEGNFICDDGFRAADGENDWQQWHIQWSFIKAYMLRDVSRFPVPNITAYPGPNSSTGAFTAIGRLGGLMESSGFTNGGCRQVVIRNNHFEGLFNGVVVRNTNTFRHFGENVDIIGNLFRLICDDNIEPEGRITHVRAIDNWGFQTINALSWAPSIWGPVYYVRNITWDTGVQGMGQYRDPTTEAAAHTHGTASESNLQNRHDGGSVNNWYKGSPFGPGSPLYATIFFVHNTHWTARGGQAGVQGQDQPCYGPNDAAATDPSGLAEVPYKFMRNNIWRVTGYAARWGATAGKKHDEDYQVLVTTSTVLGLRVNSSGGVSGYPGGTFTSTSTTGANSLDSYRTLMQATPNRPTAFASGNHVNTLGGADIAFCGATAVAAVDALFTDPVNGDLTLKVGANGAVGAGHPVCNLSDMPGVNVVGAAPDLGAMERST